MRNDQSDPFLAVLRDLLSFATTDRIPAVVVFDNGVFNPYGLPPRERTGDRGETERRAEHVEEQNTLVQDLSQSRQDLKVIEASHLSFEALADRVSRSGVTDVFIFVPVEGCLLRDLAKVEDDELSDREVAVTQADRRYLESIGLHHIDQLSGGIGWYYEQVLLAAVLSALEPGSTVAMVTPALHIVDPITRRYNAGFSESVRSAIADLADSIDIVRLKHDGRWKTSPEASPYLQRKVFGADEEPAALVRVIAGSGAVRLRFSELSVMAVGQSWQGLKDDGLLNAPATEKGQQGGAFWVTPHEELGRPWDVTTYDPQRRAAETGFAEVGDWIKLGEVAETWSYYRDELPKHYGLHDTAEGLNDPMAVGVLEMEDVEACAGGAWTGQTKEVMWYEGERGEQPDLVIRPGDILVSLSSGISGCRFDGVFVANQTHSNLIPSEDVCLFRIREPFARQAEWIRDFLLSPSAVQWMQLSEPSGASILHTQHFEELLVPIPSSEHGAGYSAAKRLEQQLEALVGEVREGRSQLLAQRPEHPEWGSLPAVIGKARSISRFVSDIDQLHVRVRALFPMPIAYSYRQFELQADPEARYREGLQLVERTAAFVCALQECPVISRRATTG